MRALPLRLILALIGCVAVVSLAFTYLDMLSHRHVLRLELERRTRWMAMSAVPEVERALASGQKDAAEQAARRAVNGTGAAAFAVFNPDGSLLGCAGDHAVLEALSPDVLARALKKGADVNAFGRAGERRWLEVVLLLHDGQTLQGAVAIVTDAGSIHREDVALWQRSFWRILSFVVLIVLVTLLTLRWFLMEPMLRVAERVRLLRTAHPEQDRAVAKLAARELSLFPPLAREVETLAESLIAAREAAANEARLRDQGENLWTAERLAAHLFSRFGSSRIFVVSNREPYIHTRQGREVTYAMPASGLVTAIEPVLRACNGVWVASGSGDADRETVDEFDRVRVPPDDPQYTLRRVWLTEEEEARYYEGFSNEGLWPLCHIAHTRPIFRPGDWECYRQINERFAAALIEEMKGSESPVVFVQDYHFTLLPRLIKTARPDARVAIFWHIPWPNPEAFGICPWQVELLDGLLGADLIGFHIRLHCNNFLATVDRALEARTNRDHMTVSRLGHSTAVRSYPISVDFGGNVPAEGAEETAEAAQEARRARTELLAGFGVQAESLILGVDRMDYTKGIEERMLALEHLLEEHPWYDERLTLVQIAAPSRTHIPSYTQLRGRVNELAERINRRFQKGRWRPIVLIERQCSHAEVARWYRAADLCLVTSLHDGMNLVAKEFVVARGDEDGVLVLSRFTGAAVELRDALVVNPYDIAGVAEAIHQGLEMGREERRQRMRQMRRQVIEHNVYKWAATILGDLCDLRLEVEQGAQPALAADEAAGRDGMEKEKAV